MTTLKEEQPYAAAVNNDVISVTCSKCFAWNFDDLERVKLRRCAGCHVLCYCSSKCQKADWKDHKAECEVLQSVDYVPSKIVRLVMRLIEKSRKQPDFKAYNGRTYDSLMHNTENPRQKKKCMAEAGPICSEIHSFMSCYKPDFETVVLAISKIVTNAVLIHEGTMTYNPRGTGIYLGLSVLDHSCRPDAFLVNQGSKMMLRTTNKDLVYSDKLTINYYIDNFYLDTHMRRAQLSKSYFFLCHCEECKDVGSHKKKTSGRPTCCPTSWFSIVDPICNNCKKEVSSELKDKAINAMELLRTAIFTFEKRKADTSALLALVPEWMELFDSCKEILSDENGYLFAIANMIYIIHLHHDEKISCKYADLCLPLVRKRPDCLYKALLLARRQQYYEMMQKPPQERKEALNEALDCAQVVLGPQHDLTQFLLQKKMFFDFVGLNTG